MKTGLFPTLYVPCCRGRGDCALHRDYPPQHLPPTQAVKSSSLGGKAACAGARGREPVFAAVMLAQGFARCSRARRQVDLPRVRVSSPRSRAAVFDLPVFGLAGRYVVCFHSSQGCVQAVEWAGWAGQAKYSRRHPARTSQARHPRCGRVGTRVALRPARCSALRCGVGERALNVVEILPAVGKSVGGKRSSSGARGPGVSLRSGEARDGVSGLAAPPPKCLLQAQRPRCAPAHGETGKEGFCQCAEAL